MQGDVERSLDWGDGSLRQGQSGVVASLSSPARYCTRSVVRIPSCSWSKSEQKSV